MCDVYCYVCGTGVTGDIATMASPRTRRVLKDLRSENDNNVSASFVPLFVFNFHNSPIWPVSMGNGFPVSMLLCPMTITVCCRSILVPSALVLAQYISVCHIWNPICIFARSVWCEGSVVSCQLSVVEWQSHGISCLLSLMLFVWCCCLSLKSPSVAEEMMMSSV